MAIELATAYVNLVPSAKGIGDKLGRELGQPLTRAGRDAGNSASKEFSGRFGLGLKSVARIAAGVFIAHGVRVGISALTHEMGSFITEAREAAKVNRLTNSVLASTGGVAKVSAKEVGDLATRLSNLSGIDDEVIQSGENVLLTFTAVRNQVGAGNDIFNQATEAAVNMSAALGQDLQSSVIQLGKALNDPIKGITALKRVGVSFTAQQIDQIKTLVASGKTLEAQKIILKELGTEFGGAAQAAADPLERLSVITGNFKEQLGGALLPAINTVADSLGKLLPGVANTLAPVISTLVPVIATVFGALLPAISPVLRALSIFLAELGGAFAQTLASLKPIFAGLAPSIGELGQSFLLIVRALLPLVPAFGALIGAVAPLGEALGGLLVRAVRTLVPLVVPLVTVVARLAQAFIGSADSPGPLIALLDGLGSAIEVFGRLLLPIVPLIGSLGRELITRLAPVIPDLAKSFADLLVALAPLIPVLVQLAVTLIQTLGVATIVGIAKALTLLATAVTPLARQTAILTPLIAALGATFIAAKGITAFQNGLLGIATAGGKAFRVLSGNVSTIKTAATSMLTLGKNTIATAVSIARTTAAFVAQKVAAAASAVATKLLAVAQGILNVVMDANPIGLVVIAIAALAAGIFLAYKKFKPFRQIVDAVGRALATAFDFVKSHWKLIVGLLVAPFITVPFLIFKNFKKIVGLLGKVGGALKTVGIAIMRGLLTGLIKGLELLAIFFIGLPILLVKLLVQANIWLLQKGFEIVKGLVTGLIGALPTIAAFFVSLPGKILGFIGDVLGLLVPKAIDLLTGFVTGLVNTEIQIALFFASLPGRILGFIGNLATTLIPKALELIGGLIFGFVRALPGIALFFLTLPSRIIGFLFNIGSKMIPKGIEIIGGLVSGVAKKFLEFDLFFLNLPKRIFGLIGDIGHLLFDVGKNVVKGLIDGMVDFAKGVGGFVKDHVVDPIKNFIKNPFGILSPSRWARDIVGKNIMLGLAHGLRDNAHLADDQFQAITSPMMSGIGIRAINAGTATAAATRPGVTIGTINARDDQDVARVIADQQRRAYALSTI